MSWRLALVLTALAASLAVMAGATQPPKVVERFLTESYPFERTVDRQYAIRGQVKDVTDELGVGRLSSGRVFSFPVKAGAPIVHALAAVDAQGSVWLLNDRESVNRLFDAVPPDAEPVETAQLLVDTFLRLISFNGYRNYGYPLGVNVLHEASDIPGLADESLAEVIQPPELVRDGKGYRFTAFSWNRAGGAVSRHTVLVADSSVRDYRVKTLATWVGAHDVMQ